MFLEGFNCSSSCGQDGFDTILADISAVAENLKVALERLDINRLAVASEVDVIDHLVVDEIEIIGNSLVTVGVELDFILLGNALNVSLVRNFSDLVCFSCRRRR